MLMTSKGFTENANNIETPSDINISEKPLNSEKIRSRRVDINILKSKLQETEAKEFRKNLFIFLSFIVGLGSIGIYLSI